MIVVNIPDITTDFVRSLPRVSFSKRINLPEEKGVYFICVEHPGFKVLYVGQSLNFRRRMYAHSMRGEITLIQTTQPVWVYYLVLDWNREDIILLESVAIKKLDAVFNVRESLDDDNDNEIIIPEIEDTHRQLIVNNISRPLTAYSKEELIDILEDIGISMSGKKKTRTWMIKTIKLSLFRIHDLESASDKIVCENNFITGINLSDVTSSISESDIAVMRQIDHRKPSTYANIGIRQMKKMAMQLKVSKYSLMTKDELAVNISRMLQVLGKFDPLKQA